jgi:transketolase
MSPEELREKSYMIRMKILDIFSSGKRGHIASAFSTVEILTILYYFQMDVEKNIELCPTRDRFILSKGHGCLALYAVLWDLGLLSDHDIESYCKPGGAIGGHPTKCVEKGIEASTGSLGIGPSVGVGMACRLKDTSPKSQVYVLVGDGEMNEGNVWEACLSAGNKDLNNFTLIIDHNKFQSYGLTKEVCDLHPLGDKLKSFKFEVYQVDMLKSASSLHQILAIPKKNKPRAIVCDTIKGQGSPLTESDLSWHHKNRISDDEIEVLRRSVVK